MSEPRIGEPSAAHSGGARDVRAYLDACEPDQRAALEEIRSIVREIASASTETISYRMPACRFEGRILVWYAAFRDHVSLFPASRFVIDRLGDEIAPFVAGRGTLRFDRGSPLPAGVIRRVVEARVAENREASAGRARRSSSGDPGRG
jgi:uncharacterized protein YdhG (YjbR/CyaY superfamily)